MKRPFRSAIALLAVSALPLVAASPAFAVIDRSAVTLDCALGNAGESDHSVAPGETVTVTLLNCDDGSWEVGDIDNTGNATIGATTLTATPISITASPTIVMVDEWAALEVNDGGTYVDIMINRSTLTDDPSGSLLASTSTTLYADSSFFTTSVGMELNDSGDPLIGGVLECDVEAGSHPYTTTVVTISTAGTYTFRVVDTAPVEEDLYFGIDSDYSPVGDNFLALYTTFDPTNIDANVVGCNDDGDDEGAPAGGLWNIAQEEAESRNQSDETILTSTGFILDDQFAWFTANLQPGQYTLVGTLYGEFTEQEWQDRLALAEATSATLYYEMWGPTGGLTLGGLADTGVNPSFALWSGLALAGTGVAITVARRRAQRA